MQKPSERINELYLEDAGKSILKRSLLDAVIRYLDEQYEKQKSSESCNHEYTESMSHYMKCWKCGAAINNPMKYAFVTCKECSDVNISTKSINNQEIDRYAQASKPAEQPKESDIKKLANIIDKTNMVSNERRANMLAESIILEGYSKKDTARELVELKKEFYKLFTQSYAGDSGIGGNDPQDPDCQFSTYPDDVWQWIKNTFGQPKAKVLSVEEIKIIIANNYSIQMTDFTKMAQAIHAAMQEKIGEKK